MNIIKTVLYPTFCFLKEIIHSVLCKEAVMESCPHIFGEFNCVPLQQVNPKRS